MAFIHGSQRKIYRSVLSDGSLTYNSRKLIRLLSGQRILQAYRAVIFDLGGVVIPSPLPLIAEFEKTQNLPIGSVNATIRHYGDKGSFSLLERGELTLEGLCAPFASEYSNLHGISVTKEQIWELTRYLGGLKGPGIVPFKEMLSVINQLKQRGVKTAILTNNFRFESGDTVFPKQDLGVDVVFQSCIEGACKPNSDVYKTILKRLGVQPSEAIFLDDIGRNLKAAKKLGIETIKVDDVDEAIDQLKKLLKFDELEIPGTMDVSAKLKIPLEPLVKYLQETHSLFQEDPLLIRQFKHGQSNPTYYIEYGGERLVLRKKPPGKLLPSAHAVEREYRVMKALKEAGVPIPRILSLCEDSSVIGTPFYLMTYVPGRVLKDPSLPTLDPGNRREIYEQVCSTLAAIHSVDVNQFGLSDFGKHGNYVKRQIGRWSKQYYSSRTHDIPEMDRLISWLPSQAPESDITTVVHGDYRMDNLIYSHENNKVLAVLDWELSTLGDPLSDLALCCLPYHLEPDSPALKGLLGRDLSALGIPSEDEFVSLYCRQTGLSGIPNWNFYKAFTFFRVAAILQGVFKRAQQNQASSDDASTVGMLAMGFAKKGWSLSQQTQGRYSPASSSGSTGRRSYSTQALSGAEITALLINDMTSFPRKLVAIRDQLLSFMEEDIFPNEAVVHERRLSQDRWKPHPLIGKLKEKACSQGLWNLFLPVETDPESRYGAGLTNLEYAHLAEIMGKSSFSSEIFNCSPPDTGNMEVLVRYGTVEQKEQWLTPLLNGEIRSCFAMTEPGVASSDATNIQSSIVREGDHYVLNGHKWWISGGLDPRCKICIFMGKTDRSAPKHKQQSMILVPMDTPGVKVLRPLTVYGFDDSPSGHADMTFTDVRVPIENILLGEGRGFEIAQGRLGPGRIHHCMRLIGMAERSLSLMKTRVKERVAFGRPLVQYDTILSDIAQSRIDIDQARLLTLKAAYLMDTVGNKVARNDIAMIKVVAPRMAQMVIDRAIQAHGAKGLSSDVPLAEFFSWARILRFADGPDEVHLSSISKMELKSQ